jgi:tRNA nucleotidyltransferase/poly(A) polymerase
MMNKCVSLCVSYVNNIQDFLKEDKFLLNLFNEHCYFAGGAIRDMVLNKKPKDIDIWFDDKEIATLFYTHLSTVSPLKEKMVFEKNMEVASFYLEDIEYQFICPEFLTLPPQERVAGFDFTINMAYFIPKSGEIYFENIEDIQNKVLRTKTNHNPDLFLRMIKFVKRGYSMDLKSLEKLIESQRETPVDFSFEKHSFVSPISLREMESSKILSISKK